MSVSDMLTDVSTVINAVVNIISSNDVLSAFLGLGIVGFGALIFKRLLRN